MSITAWSLFCKSNAPYFSFSRNDHKMIEGYVQSIYRHAAWFGLNKHRSKRKVRLVTVPMVWYLVRSVLVPIPYMLSVFAELWYDSAGTSSPVLVPGCRDAWTKCPPWNVLIQLFFEIYYTYFLSIMYVYIIYILFSLRWYTRGISIIPAHHFWKWMYVQE